VDNDANRYRLNREASRHKAVQDFYATEPDFAALLDAADEYVGHLIYSLSGKTLVKDEADEYLTYLLVTFTRCHFNMSDYARSGDLTEAIVLFRRQIETLARMHEIRAAENLDGLLRKTPNLKRLKGQLRRMYDEYSAVAHGSDARQGQLLGLPLDAQFSRSYPVMPHFNRHAYVLVGHVMHSIVELDGWLMSHAKDLGWPLDTEWRQQWWSAHIKEATRLLKTDPYGSPANGEGRP